MLRVKICCISSILEAKIAVNFGADAIGLVSKMPSGPGVISDDLICEISEKTPPPIATFLLTSETDVIEIIKQHKKVNTNTIQLVDALKSGSYHELKSALPMVKIVQVIHVINEKSIEEALEISNSVDALLLDSGNPEKKILGGTGQIHNWEFSRKIVEHSEVPVFLAGGINSHNLLEAYQIVKPFGVDLCSSVRTNGMLDEIKLSEFFKVIKSINTTFN